MLWLVLDQHVSFQLTLKMKFQVGRQICCSWARCQTLLHRLVQSNCRVYALCIVIPVPNSQVHPSSIHFGLHAREELHLPQSSLTAYHSISEQIVTSCYVMCHLYIQLGTANVDMESNSLGRSASLAWTAGGFCSSTIHSGARKVSTTVTN